MAQYIDKSAVVSEIEKEIKEYATAFSNMDFKSYEAGLIAKGKYRMSQEVLSFLNTLEVKDVDLEKEIGLFTTKELLKKRNHSTGVYHFTQNDIDNIAKHFFELGLGVQTPVFIYKPSPQNLASELGLKAQKVE